MRRHTIRIRACCSGVFVFTSTFLSPSIPMGKIVPPTKTLSTPERPVAPPETALEAGIKEISAALRRSGYSQLRQIELAGEGKRIVMRGSVDSFYLKQMAQEIARESAPGWRIYNSLKVGDNRRS